MPAAAGPLPRVEVHIFQPSCDDPLLSGKRAVLRIWAIWIADPESGETVPEFPARITARDGAGNRIARTTTIFHRYPWADQGRNTALAEHTIEIAFTPVQGRHTSPITVDVDPLKEGNPDLFPTPGSVSFTFEEGDRPRILKLSYVIPRVGRWAGGDDSEATEWIESTADAAEDFLVQNLPVHGVQRRGVFRVDVDLPRTREGPCGASTCVFVPKYVAPGPAVPAFEAYAENVEVWLARQFDQHSDESITIVLLPPGFAGDLFAGKTVLFDASWDDPDQWVSRAILGGDVDLPNFPVIVIPVDAPADVLAHEMGHVFRGPGHVPVTYARAIGGRATVATARAQGIHAFRVPLRGQPGSANKHSEEGNGEAPALEPLMKEGVSPQGTLTRFVSDAVYDDLLEGVRDSDAKIWATAEPVDLPAGARTASQWARPVVRGGPGGRSLGVSGRAAIPLVPASSLVPSTPRQDTPAALHLVVGGSVGPGGEVVLDDIRMGYRANSPIDPTQSGPYGLELRDASGAVLDRRPFGLAPALTHGVVEHHPEASTFSVAVPYRDGIHAVAVVDAGGSDLVSVEPSHEPLELELETVDVDDGDGLLLLEWSLTPTGTEASVDVLYSPDGVGSWSTAARGLDSGSTALSTVGLRRGPRPTLRLLATDGLGHATDERRIELERFDVWTRSPAPGDSLVAVDAGIRVVLNTELDAEAVGEDHLFLLDEDGSRVPGELAYDEGVGRLWLVPSESLAEGRQYRVRLSDDLRDRRGHRLRGDVEWTFRTAPDVRPPRIVATDPRSGDITLPVTLRPAVTFDEPLGGRIDQGLRLETEDGEPVAGSTLYDPKRRRLVFQPSSELQHHTSYRLLISEGVTDAAGNTLGPVNPVPFTTGGRIVVGGGR